jgi:hypothetical protein
VFQQRQRFRRVFPSQVQNARVQLGFKQAGLKFQRLAIFRDGFRVAVEHAVRQRKVEMRNVILGFGSRRFAERRDRGFELAIVKGFGSLGNVVRSLQKEESD